MTTTSSTTTCSATIINLPSSRLFPNVHRLGFYFGQYIQSLLNVNKNTTNNNCSNNRVVKNEIVLNQQGTTNATTKTIQSAITSYKEWWITLYTNNPTHIYVETTLIILIIYFLLISCKRFFTAKNRRGKTPKTVPTSKLTPQEEEDLLLEWKYKLRQPLASTSSTTSASSDTSSTSGIIIGQDNQNYSSSITNSTGSTNSSDTITRPKVTVHKNNGRLMEIEISYSTTGSTSTKSDTIHKTVLNFATFDFLGMSSDDPLALSSYNDKDVSNINDSNKQTNIKTKQNSNKNNTKKMKTNTNLSNTKTTSTEFQIQSVETYNEIQNPVKQAALDALDRYGCGSCGPRGFYGTVDVHLQLESKFAQYMGTDASILYSDGSSGVTSTIAAFCKRGDLLVVDDSCYEPIMTGILLSRANVKFFKHNDINDLRSVLKKVYDSDIKIKRKSNVQRRFIVVEGLYKNTGSICPLDEIVQLKHQYSYRLIVDESHSFGTIGPTGKGVTELYNKQIMTDVEIVTVSIENSIGSIGGLTIGSNEIVDHQRLCGVGYCFSASSPPFTAAAAIEVLNILQTTNYSVVTKLHTNIEYMYAELSKQLLKETDDIITIISNKQSPIIMLQLNSKTVETAHINKNAFVHAVVIECLINSNVAFIATGTPLTDTETLTIIPMLPSQSQQSQDSTCSTKKISSNVSNSNSPPKLTSADSASTSTSSNEGIKDPPSCIRIAVTASQTRHDIDHAIAVLIDSIDVIMNRCMTVSLSSSSSTSTSGTIQPMTTSTTTITTTNDAVPDKL